MYVNRENPKFRKMMESYPHLAEYSDPMKRMERPLIGREREMRAMRAAFERPELSNVVLLGPAGSGKALADDTLIPVADGRGYVRIADVAVGDTVFVNKWLTVYQDQWRDRVVHDSIYLSKTDTLNLVKVEVREKPLTPWQRTRMACGTASLVIVAFGIVICFIRRILKKQ
jgi:hypothetical protein